MAFVILLALSLLMGARLAEAQSSCGIALGQAQKAYAIGRFADVIDLLATCGRGTEAITRGEELEALRLETMAWIGSDYPQRAAETVRHLLVLKPNLETTLRDPLRFARLVEQMQLANADQQVTSVSKNSERVELAPETVQ